MRILVIEDNSDIAANLGDYLEDRGHTVDFAADGVTGLHLATTQSYDAIVLDVKFGHGAFMKSIDDARKLAQAMVAIGGLRGRQVRAALTSMEEPLGSQIGNALEVDEALRILRGERKGTSLQTVAYELASQLVQMTNPSTSLEAARLQVRQLVESGQALDKLGQMIEAQGGDRRVCDQPELLPQSQQQIAFNSPQDGFVASIAAETIGTAAMWLGAGRRTKSDKIDPAVGIVLHVEKGHAVKAGQRLATLHVNQQAELKAVQEALSQAFQISAEAPLTDPLIREMIS